MKLYSTVIHQVIRDGEPMFPLITNKLHTISTSILHRYPTTYDINKLKSRKTKDISLLHTSPDFNEIYTGSENLDNIYFYVKSALSPLDIAINPNKLYMSIFITHIDNAHIKTKNLNSFKCDKFISNFMHDFRRDKCGFLVSFNEFLNYLKRKDIKMNVDTFFELFRNKNEICLLPFYNILDEFL